MFLFRGSATVVFLACLGWSVPHGPPGRTDQPSGRSSALGPELSAAAQSGPGHDPGAFCDPGS
jgi:hypothetical protein